MTEMQASEIQQLDDKSFNRWCEVLLPKVYSFFTLICLRDFSVNAAREIMFCSSIIEYSFQTPTMNLKKSQYLKRNI